MQTLADLMPNIRELGGKEAIRWIKGYRTEITSYQELWGRIGAGVYFFTDRGISKGQRVLIWAENRPEWVATFWACIAAGITVVPVDVRFSGDLVDKIRADSGATFTIDDSVMDQLAALDPRPEFPMVNVSPDDVVEMVYTSGTTGEPKGIIHRHRNICANLAPFQSEIGKYRRLANLFRPVRLLNLLPLSHLFGQSQALFIPLFLRGSVAFANEFQADAIARIVHDNRISVVVCVPRMLEMAKNEVERRFRPRPASGGLLRRILRHRRIHKYFGWKFWAFVVGGARVDAQLEEFWGTLGFAVIQGYGMTEASPVVAVNHPFSSRRGSIGKAVPGQEVRVAADGEILVRGASVVGAVDEDGWLHTGDLGEMDSEGRLYFRGRKKDLIVTPEGLNVVPEDVEAVLKQFPEIRDSAVVNVNEQVHAAIILTDPAVNATDVVRRANETLEAHQRIRAWTIWSETDFPRTPSTLKVRRAEVADRIRTGNVGMPQEEPDIANLSSLERVELLSELESRHGLTIDEAAFSKITNNAELARLREQSLQAQPPPAAIRQWPLWLPVRWFRSLFQSSIAIPLFRNRLPLTVIGLENLAGVEAPVLFAANHASDLDTPAIFAALPYRWWKKLAPAMRAEYFDGRLVSYLASRWLYNGYLLPQGIAAVRTGLMATEDLIRRGYCPLIYPEGRRTLDGTLQAFQPGIGMLAVKLRTAVIPIYLEGMHEIYPPDATWPKRGAVRVVIGSPIYFSATESYGSAAQQIHDRIARLADQRDPA